MEMDGWIPQFPFLNSPCRPPSLWGAIYDTVQCCAPAILAEVAHCVPVIYSSLPRNYISTIGQKSTDLVVNEELHLFITRKYDQLSRCYSPNGAARKLLLQSLNLYEGVPNLT